MSSPIFSNMIRTKEELTCGITNIPLTKSAKINFIVDTNNNKMINDIYALYDSLSAEITRHDNHISGKTLFQSMNEFDYKTIKLVWRNFKNLHPKFQSQWRYLFWEIDNDDKDSFNLVINIYNDLNLPLYLHRTMRGYHFFSVVPILENVFLEACKRLRPTNPKYPPITLRVNANKWINELDRFREGFVITKKSHSDTMRLRDMIYHQDFIKLGEQYQLVWYPIDHNDLSGVITP